MSRLAHFNLRPEAQQEDEWGLLQRGWFWIGLEPDEREKLMDTFDLLCEAARNVYGKATVKNCRFLLERINASITDPWYFIDENCEARLSDLRKLELLTSPHWRSLLKMMDIQNGRIPETGLLADDQATAEKAEEAST